MRADEIADLLTSVDSLLVPQGFRRRSRSREWRKKLDRSNETWVHVNIGIDMVNPSIGVTYLDLAGVLPKDAGSVYGTMKMLSGLFSPAHTYSLGAGPETLLRDLRGNGLVALDRLLDRPAVAEML